MKKIVSYLTSGALLALSAVAVYFSVPKQLACGFAENYSVATRDTTPMWVFYLFAGVIVVSAIIIILLLIFRKKK